MEKKDRTGPGQKNSFVSKEPTFFVGFCMADFLDATNPVAVD